MTSSTTTPSYILKATGGHAAPSPQRSGFHPRSPHRGLCQGEKVGYHGYMMAIQWIHWAYNIWLVVSTPLKNIRQMGLSFPIYGKNKTVPNHQPDKDLVGEWKDEILVGYSWDVQRAMAYDGIYKFMETLLLPQPLNSTQQAWFTIAGGVLHEPGIEWLSLGNSW